MLSLIHRTLCQLLVLLVIHTFFPGGIQAAELKTLGIDVSFSVSADLNKTHTGYRLYQDGLLVCETTDPAASTLSCEILTEPGTFDFTLSALYDDFTESPQSAPFQFTIAETTPPPEEPPPSTGSMSISYSWEASTGSSNIAGFRMYMNDVPLCQTSDPAAASLTCSTDLLTTLMNFSVVSFDSANVESQKSNFLTLDPADFPELFPQKTVFFQWEYTDGPSNTAGFRVFNNNQLLCSTADPAARQLSCSLDQLESTNSLTMAAVDLSGILTNMSNTIIYTPDTGSPPPPPEEELVAAISAAPTTGTAPMTVNFDGSASTGNISSYTWDYGDGDQGSGVATTHTYATSGTFTASLEVIDSAGVSSVDSTTIVVEGVVVVKEPPTAVISSSTAAGEAPLDVAFDGSGSTTTNQPMLSYDWNLGDGTQKSGATISHTYSIEGTYNSELTVLDSASLTDSESTPVVVSAPISTNEKPVADFTASPNQGQAPLNVTLDASASSDTDGTITTFLWNFGDGNIGTGKTVEHTYTTAAGYTVTLEVTDDDGEASDPLSKSILVTETEQEPTLNYEVGEIQINHEWVKVPFESTFNQPIVVLSPPTNNDKEAVVVATRNLTNSGFEVRLQEWDYLDNVHALETISFLVLEQGATALPDGTLIESGTFTSDTRKTKVAFQQPFTETPVILTAVVSQNGTATVTGRLSDTSAAGFTYRLQEQEASKSKHASELITYIAWSSGKGTVDNLAYSATIVPDAVTDAPKTVPFGESLPSQPFIFANLLSTNSIDTAALRLESLNPDTVELFVQEDQSKDDETSHAAETVGVLGLATTTDVTADTRNVTVNWEYDAALESSISGFRIFANGTSVCETTDSSARQLICEISIVDSTLFTVRAVDSSGQETTDSNAINFKQ